MTGGLVFDSRGSQKLGSRKSQNDSFLCGETAAFVADGMGNADGARAAADAAVRYYVDLAEREFTPDDLLAAPEHFASTWAGMPGATTLAGAILDDTRLWFIGHGDSIALHVRDGELLSRSIPHNEAGRLASMGIVAPASAANALTRALSAEPVGVSDIRLSRAIPGDTVVLMTDGFATLARIADIVAISSRGRDAADVRDALLQLVVDNVPDDNATFVVARVMERTEPTGETPA